MGRVKTPEIPAFVGDGRVDHLARWRATHRRDAVHDEGTRPAARRDTRAVLSHRRSAIFRCTGTVYSPGEWKAHSRRSPRRRARRSDRRTTDHRLRRRRDADSERAHGLQERERDRRRSSKARRTREARNGWFSYEVKVAGGAPITIVCSYRGSEGRRRIFDVLVDGQKIATETLESSPPNSSTRSTAFRTL